MELQLYQSSLFITCLFAALALPLVSALVSLVISEKYSWLVAFTAPFLLLLGTLASAAVFYWTWNHSPFMGTWDWFTVAGHTFTMGILLNNLSSLMLLTVSFISFLVNVYSTGYMAGDPDLRQYFGMLGFFTFSMLGLVVADNLLMIFVFWELVSFSSYMLIGHWREKPAAADAAKRAFLINRVGDIGFLIGLMVLWGNAGTFDLHLLSTSSQIIPWQTTASICLFCGVVGKSAQFPLFAWLPDAMEGPTPVSALIHAATMVAAGVFLLARVFFLFTPFALDIVAITGCITALLGALAALAQYDIKKILAYSTISQLGFMVLAVGAGAPEAAILHLITHAFFKACLFLAAGSVIHALHQAQNESHTAFDVQDIRNLGGLRKKLPFTFIVFVMSGSALAGLPFFSGYLSKDAILTSLLAWKGTGFSWRWLVFAGALIIAFLTVLYAFRMIWSLFYGHQKATEHLSIAEPPAVMRAPMAILALASLWLLVSQNPFGFDGWIYSALRPAADSHDGFMSIFSALWVLVALMTAYAIRGLSFNAPIAYNGFYLNKIYKMTIEAPVFQLAQLTTAADKKWIDGFLHTAAYLQLIVAHVSGWFDRAIIDGIVDSTAGLAKGIGSFTRSFQGGKIQLYIFWAIFAVIIFIIWTVL